MNFINQTTVTNRKVSAFNEVRQNFVLTFYEKKKLKPKAKALAKSYIERTEFQTPLRFLKPGRWVN